MNNMIPSFPSLQTAPAVNVQKGTPAGSDLFQSLFQQAASGTANETISYPDSSVPVIKDVQDKQDMQVVLEAFFNKMGSGESLEPKEPPEDAWELVGQVLGENNLAAFLPSQLRDKAEQVLRNIKPSGQESAVDDMLTQLAELQAQLNGSNASANADGITAALQQTLPPGSMVSSAITKAGNPSKNQTDAAGINQNSSKDLAMLTGISSHSDKRDPSTALQTSKLVSAANTMDSESARSQTALQESKAQSQPKLTEMASAIRRIVEASAGSNEKTLASKSVSTQQKQDFQTFDPKQISTLQVSKQEQLVFHLKQADQAPEQAGKELVQKLEQAVKFSGMLSDRNGLKELSIQLRPGNLGDLQVKLVRENGDITVQIVAASKQAKDMLDSNISSLKHMFSPHQVSITERVDQLQATSPERNSQQQFQDDNEGQQDRQQRQQQQEIQDSMDTSFAEILSEQEGIRI